MLKFCDTRCSHTCAVGRYLCSEQLVSRNVSKSLKTGQKTFSRLFQVMIVQQVSERRVADLMRLAQFRMLGADAGSFRSPTHALSSRPRRAVTGAQR